MGKSTKLPFLKRLGLGDYLYLWEALDFIHFMCYNLVALEDGVKERVVIKRIRGLFLFIFFIDLE